MGVIRDADKDPKAAFQSVKDALKAAGLPIPRKPMNPSKGPPKINVLIVPSTNNKGELEDLCLEAVVCEPAMACTEEFFNCLHQKEASILEKDLSKAKVRVFLASQENPTLPLGLAARKGY